MTRTVHSRARWTGYLLALSSVGLVPLIRQAGLPALAGDQAPLLLFLMAITFSAWYGGLGPGLVATLAAILTGTFMFSDPALSFAVDDPSERAGLVLVEGTVISLLCHNLLRARRRAEWDAIRIEAERAAARAAEADLRDSEGRFRALLNSTAEAIVGTSVNGDCTFVNAACLRMLGYDAADELIGADMHERVHHTDGNGAPVPRDRCPLAVAYADGRPYHCEEELLWRKDGTPIWVELWSHPVLRDGRPVGTVITFLDLTDRKRTQAEAERFFNVSADLLCIVGFDGYFKRLNPAWERVLGWTAAEMTGRHWHEFVLAEDWERTITDARLAIERPESLTVENRYRARDGSIHWLRWRIRAFRDEGLLYAAADDVTERKRDEAEREALLAREQSARTEAEAANRAKDEFLATLSHELRTPLTALLAWSNLLRTSPDEPELLAEGLEAIERSANSQAQLVEDILDVSRIITGKLRLRVVNVNLAEVIEDALETVRSAADAKRVRLTADLAPGVNASADPDRLRQVVWNLVINAIKFTPEGGEVVVRLGQDNSRARITVTDTGAGIATDFLPYVFDRFRQADGTTTRRHGGLGLGLAIVRHVVEMHGGTVSARSEGEGRGSEFTVELPIPALEPEAPPTLPVEYGLPGGNGNGDEVAAPSSLAGVVVVVVDDEPDALRAIESVLQHCGAHVVPAASAAEALDRLTAPHHTPQVLVSDIGMPGEDGYALIRKLRAMEAAAHAPCTPAAALTAYTRSEDRAKTLAAGYDVYVPKPVKPRELAMIVAGLAGRA